MNKFYTLQNKSFESEGVATYKELWDKVKDNHRGFNVCLNTEYTKAEGSDNRFHVIMSTATQDRHGEIVKQKWDLKSFKKNPVFLDSHNYSSIEHIIGRVHNIKVKDDKLQGDVEFALDNPKGLLAYKLASGGFLNATSVGFIPLDFDEKGNITKSELLEDSAVSVPANAEALFEKALPHSPTHSPDENMVENKDILETPDRVGDYTRVLGYFQKREQEQKARLVEIAKQIKGITPENTGKTKRDVYKNLRAILKQR